MLMCELEPMEYTVTMEDEMYEEYEKKTNDRDCENCIHARPFGGENDNRCDAWECEYIDRQEAIEAYKARKDIDLVRCGECKWGEELAPELIYCEDTIGGALKRTDFCSYGERRE